MNSPLPLLQGRLLLADPSLHASWFARSVIYLTAHSADGGSHGLVLNRPAEGGTLGDLMSSPDFEELKDVPVFEGGPVSPQELILVGLRWNPDTRGLDIRSPLGIAGAVKSRREGWQVRAFTGYTGWSGGQLEEELQRSSWIVSPPQATTLEVPPHTLWPGLMRRMENPWHALMAELPDDPSVN